jgi:pimeloyl-ACP methyl ester carboxylesterase
MTRSDRHELLKTMRSVPSQTVNWRLSLLREFEIDDSKLRQLTQPVLLIGAGSDRLLPSVSEVERIAGIIPTSQVLILPNSGHACLLEKDINLYEILKKNNFLEVRDQRSQINAVYREFAEADHQLAEKRLDEYAEVLRQKD